jgi:ribosomal protein S18 acetylase RimI-like enzyme
VRTFQTLAAHSDPERFIPLVLPWVHEAGAAYFDWIFGGDDPARRALASWMKRRSSEVSISRFTLLFDGSRPIGGFVALGGADLVRCRKADAAAVVASAGRTGRQELLPRIAAVRGLFRAVQPDEFYLSKVGVSPDKREAGLGRALVTEYLAVGRAAGFRRFRLDVAAQNQAAVALYRSLGFEVAGESGGVDGRIRYLAMVHHAQDN